MHNLCVGCPNPNTAIVPRTLKYLYVFIHSPYTRFHADKFLAALINGSWLLLADKGYNT